MHLRWLVSALACACLTALGVTVPTKQPHIVLIVADDLGWADVSYHGSDFPTPNIDSLANTGVDLQRYYVQPVCSPTRAAMLSGRFPFRTGMQHYFTVQAMSEAHLPKNATTIAEHLRDQGYATHMVGKWHLGSSNWDYTPVGRGFDSFTGYLQGAIDYYSKVYSADLLVRGLGFVKGFDFWRNKTAFWESKGTYSMDQYREASRAIIEQYDANDPNAKPLFLYYAHQEVHVPLEAPPPSYKTMQACSNVTATKKRNKLCQMSVALDNEVGGFVDSLKKKGIWDDTILWFTSDNGGSPGFSDDLPASAASSNFPFRGGKGTLFEGGVRGVSFVTGGRNVFPRTARGTVNRDLLHAVDILPTLVARGRLPTAPAPEFREVDGVDVWEELTTEKNGHRDELPLNINPDCYECVLNPGPEHIKDYSAIIKGDWKLIQGYVGPYDGWWSNGNYTWEKASKADTEATIHLFNLTMDEEERHNVADEHPDIVKSLVQRIAFYADIKNGYVKEQSSLPILAGLPILHNGTFCPWEPSTNPANRDKAQSQVL